MKKIAIFGSSFNPPHLGHVYLVKEARKLFKFDKIYVIPTGQNPLSPKKHLPPGRFKLVQEIFKDHPFVQVEDREIQKKNPSWTIDTLASLMKENPKARFFILIGLDQWALFDRWKNFKSLLKKAHIVIFNRKGFEWPKASPPFIKELMFTPTSSSLKAVQSFKLKKNSRVYGRDIYYLPSKINDISSSQVRSLFEKGQPFDHLVPKGVREWIILCGRGNNLERIAPKGLKEWGQSIQSKLGLSSKKGVNKANTEYPFFIERAIEVLNAKQGEKIKVFDLRKEDVFPFDWTVVVSGLNTRHTKAIAEALKQTFRKKLGLKVFNMEGLESGEWIVLDYGDVVIHVFYKDTREHYRLEDLWPHF